MAGIIKIGKNILTCEVKDIDLLGREREPKIITYSIEDNGIRIPLRAGGLSGFLDSGMDRHILINLNEKGNPTVSRNNIFGEIQEPSDLVNVEGFSVSHTSFSREIKVTLTTIQAQS